LLSVALSALPLAGAQRGHAAWMATARPLAYGVDYVLHSCTKYLGGHNDVLAGAIIGRADKMEEVRKFRGVVGEQLACSRPGLISMAATMSSPFSAM